MGPEQPGPGDEQRLSDVVKQFQAQQEQLQTDNPGGDETAINESVAESVRAGAHPQRIVARVREQNRRADLERQVEAARTDSLTGLENRVAYFQAIHDHYQAACDRVGLDYQQVNDPVSGDAYFRQQLAELRHDPELAEQWLVRFDVAYLSYWNDAQFGGHAAGDTVLKIIGNVLKDEAAVQPDVRAFRISGDEDGLLAHLSFEQIKDLQQTIQVNVAHQPTPAGAELPLRIDPGAAPAWEGVQAAERLQILSGDRFRQSLLAMSSDQTSFAKNMVSVLVSLADQLADFRATRQKAVTGLGEMVTWYETDRGKLARIGPFLQKGTTQPSPEEIAALAALAPAERPPAIRAFVEGRLRREQTVKLETTQALKRQQRIVVWDLVYDRAAAPAEPIGESG